MPLAYCTIAPGEGQALRQPGSSQCMQPSLRISHSRSPFGILVFRKAHQRPGLVASGRAGSRSAPVHWCPISSRRSFHSMQATWQALQPMHLVVSMSLATCPAAQARAHSGTGSVVAERRTMSRDCKRHVSLLSLLDLDKERLEFRRLRVARRRPTGVSVLARNPGFATPVKPQ